MQVRVGETAACVRISGRANFNTSIDFKKLLFELQARGFHRFLLDLTDCILMDSTFLGVLAGFGLQSPSGPAASNGATIELYHAQPRILELLENLGVLGLFQIIDHEGDPARDTCPCEPPAPAEPSREEVTRTCLEAHKTLMDLSPENAARFKDVAKFLAEDLQKIKAAGT